jgi:hypothetical protein
MLFGIMEKDKLSSRKTIFWDFLKVFLLPMVFNKCFLVYFAVKYTSEPGRGYGYAALFFLGLLFVTIGTFLWKYRDIDDP